MSIAEENPENRLVGIVDKAILQTVEWLGTSRTMTGEELKKVRESLRLSQRELGKILGVSHVTILRAEKTETLSRSLVLFLQQAFEDGTLKFPEDGPKPG
jgi:DNA-binding XRE family transcriptional regulator